jgi:hypothetical protein
MKRSMMLALLVLSLVGALCGCVVYPVDYGHPHYWHDRGRW